MSIVQALIGAIASSGLGGGSPAINIYGWVSSMNEGSTNTVTVDYENYPSTTIYWQIVNDGTSNDDFIADEPGGAQLGNFQISGTGSTSFSWTTTEDLTTEGNQNYLLQVGTTLGGNNLLNETLTITDTSLAPEPPFSLEFVENQNDNLLVAASSDFNLGTTWTIEFWLNANAASSTAGGGIWGLLNQGGWGATNSVVVALSDNKLVFLSVANNANDDVRYTEPTPGQWTHVAIANNAGTQKVFYNGFEQTRVSGNVGTASYTNSTDPLRIGRLSPPNGGTLNGKMAMVRISNSAKYSAAFTPTVTYGVDANTKLFLDSNTPLVDISSSTHTITNTGVTASTTFVNRYTATHPAGNQGSSNVHIENNPTNNAWVASVPQGARIISSVTGRFLANTVVQADLDGNWFFVVGGSNSFTAGETHTFIW
jgi:hypothetical protein